MNTGSAQLNSLLCSIKSSERKGKGSVTSTVLFLQSVVRVKSAVTKIAIENSSDNTFIKGLVSAYTVKKYHPNKDNTNNEAKPNILDRQFNQRQRYEAIVSDLTYVRVGNEWNYICILLDLHNREIVGYSCGKHKDAQLVYSAIATVKTNLYNLRIFHTDRGSEFKNGLIDDLLKEFNIHRSLSAKGCPYDNAVAEAQFKIIKTEFVRSRHFENLQHLSRELAAYVYWFYNKRIHGSLGYKTQVQFRQSLL